MTTIALPQAQRSEAVSAAYAKVEMLAAYLADEVGIGELEFVSLAAVQLCTAARELAQVAHGGEIC